MGSGRANWVRGVGEAGGTGLGLEIAVGDPDGEGAGDVADVGDAWGVCRTAAAGLDELHATTRSRSAAAVVRMWLRTAPI